MAISWNHMQHVSFYIACCKQVALIGILSFLWRGWIGLARMKSPWGRRQQSTIPHISIGFREIKAPSSSSSWSLGCSLWSCSLGSCNHIGFKCEKMNSLSVKRRISTCSACQIVCQVIWFAAKMQHHRYHRLQRQSQRQLRKTWPWANEPRCGKLVPKIQAREISPRSGQIEDPPWPGCCTSDKRIDLSKEILLLYFRYTNVWA